MKKNIKLLAFLLIFVLFTSAGCSCGVRTEPDGADMEPVTLTYWRVWDGPDTFSEIIAKYNALHPFIKVEYRQLRYAEYEQKLLEAFASDRVPDMFSIHNTWTRKYQNRGWISPMPRKTSLVYPEVIGSIKKETVFKTKDKFSPSLNELKENFVDVVYDDIVIEGTNPDTGEFKKNVYGMPMAVDTLIMFVNRDLFNNAGITNIPKYWDKEFQQTVRKLTKQDNKGQILQAGAALGGGSNITRSNDILSVLMMQNGTEMMNLDNSQITFHMSPEVLNNESKIPGIDALRFYTDFANPAKEVYTWNTTMDNSLDLFIRGKVAMMFGYSYMIPEIKAGNPKMNLLVTRLPQIEDNTPVNFANYWVEVVSKKSQHKEEAWDFIMFATEAENVTSYLDQTKKITAIRRLVDIQKEDLDLAPYAEQALTAKSWYKGNDANASDQIMQEMVDTIILGQDTVENTLEIGVNKVQQTLKEEF